MHLFAKRVLSIILTFLFLWIGGLGVFIFMIPTQITDEQTKTQATVVLTGGRERLKTGFQMLCSKQSDVIFISGVHPEETLKSILKIFETSGAICTQDRNNLAAVTHLGHAARNTKENAEETAIWLQQTPIKSFRLVTAAYHMPRSLLEFNHRLPHITIIPHPVFPNGFNRSDWWHAGTFHLMVSEYNKFLLAFIRIHMPFALRNN